MAPDDRPPRPTDDDDLPDPALFWRWVHRATRPWVGWVLVGLGALLMLAGYFGVSREVLVAKQLPYFISGGVGGLFCAVLGAYFLGTEALRRDSGRLDRVERMVEELHAVLLSRPDAPEQPASASASSANGHARLVVLPDGERYHVESCAMVEGKDGVTEVTPAAIRKRKLSPCALCEPGTPAAAGSGAPARR